MKKILILFLAALVLGIGFYFMRTQNTPKEAEIVVSPQTSTTTVLISRATLPADGYVVIRGVDGTRLSQIVEISPFLEKGTHKNIQINFDSYSNGSGDLIAMLYTDNGDKSFSGITRPYKDSNGHVIATDIRTGKAVPTSITEQSGGVTESMGMKMARVTYTDNGFDPATTTVPVNTMVEFVNESSGQMWVASNPHPQHSDLPTFDEFEGVELGEVYTYTFDKKGVWHYHDHINPAREGVVIVKESI